MSAALEKSVRGVALTHAESREFFGRALDGEVDPVALGALLASIATRGETVAEIAGAAEALRARMRPFDHDAADAIDTAGTGGDGLGTFNVSTAAAIVAAAAGARVIKHGNRAASSRCGCADLLEALGLPLEIEPGAAREVLERCGITFLFAPLYHPALRAAAPVRKALRIPTLFNWLGPLANPGRVRRQLLGVGAGERVGAIAGVLRRLGCERALVVHGAGGADELTLGGPNRVAAVGALCTDGFDARTLGLEAVPVASLAGADAAHNAAMLARVLAGERGPLADAVALNAAAALHVAALCDGPASGFALARRAIESGAARRKLDAWLGAARATGGCA
jgi:anthranilate phosphoribosyltransferase